MAERKQSDVIGDARIDRQIREAQEQGLFDGLPGKGKPLAGLDRPHDGMWWVNKLLDREDIRGAPPTLAVRKAREEALERIPTARSEAEVRTMVDGVNHNIRQINRLAADGPPSTTMPILVEEAVQTWRTCVEDAR